MCHVLIIEDEPFIAMAIEAMLESEGATSFDYAVTETEAVETALARRPEFITSDVKLIRGTGPLAVQRIHQLLGYVPVIFITATPCDCQPCEPPGVILSKPIREPELRQAFHRMLG